MGAAEARCAAGRGVCSRRGRRPRPAVAAGSPCRCRRWCRRVPGTASAGPVAWRAVPLGGGAVGGDAWRRHGAGESPRHRVGHLVREPPCLGGVPAGEEVGEERGEPARVALADRAHLPGVLSAVELQDDHRGLAVQSGDGVVGDLGAVRRGHRDVGRREGAEAGRSAGARRQCEQHREAVGVLGQRRQVDGEPVVGRDLLGDLEAGQGGCAGVGHPSGAGCAALCVAQHRACHDRLAGRDPDLQSGPGQWMVLSPDQLGRHRRSPPCVLSCVCCSACCRAAAGYRCGRIVGIRSWKVRPLAGVPRAVIDQPEPVRCTFAMICAVYAPPPARV